MNIENAKKQIINTVKAYLAKDETGRYLIPQKGQRPVLLIGPPGIGKTEIMSQIASELGIGLLSYSMTHHTRQSAIGLPIIKHREYDGESYDITEYTMSEILSSVYELMERSGVRQGILFLDEINCISETLMPIMLQFLQMKVFGGHKLPEGWVVVTAGNPPEYNNSVREFDIVTCDRLKLIEAEPEFDAWKKYAYLTNVHSAVITYLEIKPQSFYKIESASGKKSFVTARGWDDLGRALHVYEQLGLEAGKELIGQYIRIQSIADDFALYYELYNKYKSDYKITAVLSGEAGDEVKERAVKAKFDERYSILGLLLDAIRTHTAEVLEKDERLLWCKGVLERLKSAQETEKQDFLRLEGEKCLSERERLKASGGLSENTDRMLCSRADTLKKLDKAFVTAGGTEGALDSYREMVSALKADAVRVKGYYSNCFKFCEEAFGQGQEMLILVTELAAHPLCAKFISTYGCDEYYKYDKALMLYERRSDIISEIDKLSSQTENVW